MPEPRCSFDDCEREIYNRTHLLCEMHNRRRLRWGSPGVVRKVVKYDDDTPCRIDGCERMVLALGMCSRHYARQRQYGDAEYPSQPKGPAPAAYIYRPCSFDGCDDDVLAKALCRNHYNQQHRRQSNAPSRRKRDRIANKRRRARMLGAETRIVTDADWLRLVRRYRGRCAYCETPDGKLTQEHVIPLSRGGRHSIGNLLPVCRSCNSSKRERLLVEWRAAKWPTAA